MKRLQKCSDGQVMMIFEHGQVVAEREYTVRFKSPLDPSVFALFAM